LPIALLNLLVECSDDIEQVRHVVLWIPRGTTMPNSANNPLI
jgi:hypothetical protein